MITDKEPAERLTEEQKLMAPENPYHQHILISGRWGRLHIPPRTHRALPSTYS